MTLNGLLFSPSNVLTVSVGIIGGADGPTAILVTTSPLDWALIAVLAAAVVALVSIFIYKVKHRKKKKFRLRRTKKNTETDDTESGGTTDKKD